MAASPLLNIIGHNPVLSMPLLQRMNNQNLEVIQGLKKEVKSAGVTNSWFYTVKEINRTLYKRTKILYSNIVFVDKKIFALLPSSNKKCCLVILDTKHPAINIKYIY